MTEGGRYLLCDLCTIETFTLDLPWTQDSKTLQEAKANGWKLEFDRGQRLVVTLCPKCKGELAKDEHSRRSREDNKQRRRRPKN